MKKALLLIITLQILISLSTKAQCSFTTTINNSGTATGCGPRVLTANEAGNVWTQKANFGGYGGQGAYEQIAFSIGTKGYMGLGYNSVIYASGNDFWEYDPATDSWTQKANFGGVARQAASAFAIGNRGYVSCGYNNATSTYYNDLWEYDPIANTWTQKAALPGTTREYAAAFSIGNKGYVGTGFTSTGTLTADFYEYDPSANSWTQKANFAGGLRYSARSFAIGSKGYIGQGSDLSAALIDNWEYDPATDTWVQKANFPGPGRIHAVSFAIGSRGYVGTGVNTSYSIYYNDLYQYNPVANSWTAMSPLSTLDGRYSASAFVIGANAYLMNGLSTSLGYLSSVYKYAAPISYAWNTGATTQAIIANTSGTYSVTLTNGAGCTASANIALVLAPQPTLSLGGSTAICSGGSSTLTVSGASTYTWSNSSNATSIVVSPTAMTTYCVSGTTGTCVSTATHIVTPYATFAGSIAVSGSSASCGSATLVAAQAGDTWMQKANFSGAARYYAGGFSIGDRAYLGTGLTSGAVNDFYEYNYSTNAWTAKASVGTSGRYNAVIFAVGTKGYIGMGNNGTNGLNDFWEYDPAADAWTQKANFAGVPVQGAGAMVVGNNAYIVGGTEVATNSLTSQNWEFNPQANTWALKANFPGGKRRNLTTFGNSTLGYAGMGFNSIYFFDFYSYNPATDTWTSKASYPGLGREMATAFVIGSKAYVGIGIGSSVYSDMYQYNMATDSWQALSNFGGGARYGAVGFSIGGRGYIATGYNGSTALADLWEYTLPGTYLWSNSATAQNINPLSSGLYSVSISNAGGCSSSASQSVSIAANPTLSVSGPTSNCVGNNITLSVSGASSYTWSANAGGGNNTNVSLSPTVSTNYTVSGTVGSCTGSTTYYVNGTSLSASITAGGPTVSCGNQTLTAVATATTWVPKNNFGGGARSGASAFAIGNKAYIALGISSSQVYYNDLWEYDYTSDSWTQKATYPSYPRNYATAFAIGTKGYVACGNGSSILYNDLWEYNQATNVWTQKSPFPGAVRYKASGFALSSKGYVGCGVNFSSVYYNDFYQYDPTTDTWTQKASLTNGRHGAVGFVVGTKGYVGLGLGSTGYLADIWEYDATLDTWTAKAAFGGTARMNAVAITIGSNAYVGTGITSSTVYNDFWKFNPGSNTWNQIANYSPGVRHSAVAVAIGGKGFVMTGQNLFFNTTTQEVYEFQPTPSYLWSTGSALTVINPSVTGLYTFTTTNYVGCTASASQSVAISPNPTTSISATSTLFCTSGSSATLTASGASSYSWSSNAGGGSATSVVVSPTIANIYTLTGTTGTCVITNTLLIDAYTTPTISVVPVTPTAMCGAVTLSANASGNTWTQKASFGGTARYGAVAFSIGNKGYFGTGYDGANKNDFWEYDMGNNVWTQKANFGGTARRHAAGFAIGNKGYIGTGFTSVAVADFWEYNPATNSWTARTNYPSSLYGCAGFAIGTKGYIQGGTSNGTSYVSSLREYDPIANTWITKNGTPASFAFGAAFVIGTNAYVFGGQNGAGFRNTLYMLNSTSGFWSSFTLFPGTARMGCSAFAIGTKGFVVGGYDGVAKSEVYEFNTSGNTWTQRSSITTARYYAAAFAAYNHGFVISGFTGSGNLGENWQYDARPTYSWSGSGTTETVSLSSSGTYTLNATWAGGCTASALQTISVTPFPTITISGSTVNTCGGSVTLTGSGASTSYTWSANAGGGNSSSAVISPTVNTTYTLSGNNGSCSGTGTVAVVGKKTFTTSIVSAIPTTTCGSITLSLSPVHGNTMTAKTNFGGDARYAAAGFAIGYKGYVGTGYTSSGYVNDFWEYDAVANVWTQKANYPQAVGGAVGFAIGAYGYIGLGDDGSSSYNTNFYRYNPATNSWSNMASPGGAGGRMYGVGFATATKGYLATGINLSGELNDLNEYDPTTNTWTVKASLPSTARRYATGFCINNKGYVGLGNNGTLSTSFNDFWEYDPAANTWAQKSGYPGNGILGSNALAIGNRGFVGCGASSAGIPQSDMWEYSPTTNSWTAAASISSSRYFGVGFSTPTRGYICTGYNGGNLSDLIEFEPVFQGTWSNGSVTTAMTTSTTGNYSVLVTNADGCTTTASQTVALSPAVPLTISSTSVICAGQTATLTASGASTYSWGATAGNSTSSLVSSTPSVSTIYSVIAQTGSCTAIGSVAVSVNPLPVISISAPGGTAVCGSSSLALNASGAYVWLQRATCGNSNGRMYGVAFSIGSKGYVGTGYGISGYNNDFWEYEPATNAWTQKANFSGGARQYAAGFSIGTKGYVGTGNDGSSSLNDFWEFDPSANTWTQKTNFGGGSRYAAVGFSIGTKGYIGTGIGAGYLNDLWEYDPGANSWTQKTNFGGTGRFSACAFSIGSKGYISSGYLSPSALANDIWEYDQASNIWTQKTSYTLAGRYDAASASANNKGYIIGGDGGSGYLAEVLEYNPVSNVWVQVASLTAGASGARAFAIGTKLFAQGGYSGGYNDNLYEYTGSNYPFVWSITSTLSAITVTSSGNYSVTTTNSLTGCSNTAVQSVSIVPGISVTVSGPTLVCSGNASLSANGASNYTWSANAGSSTLATTVVSPTTTTTYSVLGALGTCTSSAVYSVGIAAPITVSATLSPASVCSGGTVALSGTGASTYTWSGGVTNGVAFTPTASGAYTVSGTSASGCTGTFALNVIVNPNPTISVSGGAVCSGSTFTLLPTGASTYTFSGGSAVVSPTVTTNYSVTGTSVAGCISTAAAIATVVVSTCSQAAALAFDGSNDYVITPNLATQITPTSNITIEAWIKANSAGVVIDERGSTALPGAWYASQLEVLSNSVVAVRVWNSASLNIGAVTFGTWNHVVLRYNHSLGRLDGFVNGVQSTNSVSVTRQSPVSSSLGQHYGFGLGDIQNLGSGAYFNGAIDEVRIWNTARTPCEINTYMNCEIPTSASGLVANYHFNQGNAGISNPGVTTLNDASGNNNNAALNNFGLTGTTSNWISPGGVLSNFTTTSSPPSISVNSGSICSGGSFTITPSGASSYTYSGGSAIVTPTTSTNYSVTGTNSIGCVSSVAIASVAINAGPSLTVAGGAVCAGNSYTINPAGATSYTYSSGSAVFTPTATSNYTVTGANAIGCTSSKVINVAYNPQPTLSVSSVTSVCAGSTLALNTTGATNLIAYYRLDEGSGTTTADLSGNGLNGTLVGSPTWGSSTAPLTGAGNNLTFNTAYVSVPDNALFNTLQNQISIEAWIYQTDNTNNAIVDRASYNFLFETCPNGQTGLGFYNNGTWNYSSGTVPVNQWVHVAMTFDANAGLVKFYMNGVLLSMHVRTGTLAVNAGPLNIGRQEPNSCQCNIFSGKIDELRIWRGVRTADQFLASSTSTITARNYSWTPSASLNSTTAASVLATPTSATVYTVTLTDANNCSASAVTAFTVNASPTITVPSSTICSGSTTTITASGANTYTWSNATVSSSIVVTPTANTVYSVSGTNSLGCVSGVSTSSITLGAGPSIVVNSSTVCAGTSATLTASGVNTFTWSTGAHSSSIVVTPATNTVYLVNGNLSGCAITASNTASVTVNSLPVITASNGSLCSGNSFTLNPSGASTYTYSSGSAIVNPTVTTSYTISGTDALGCVSAAPALATVTVNAIPVIAAANGTICGGETFTILPTGAASYTYSSGSNIVSPSTSTFFTVSGTSSAGCVSATSATVTVSVNSIPVIAVNSGTICSGQIFSINPVGANTYTYSGGSNLVSPTNNTVYSVVGTGTNGCVSASVNASLTVNPLPVISVNSGSICSGNSFTISPSGASTYTFLNGASVVSPTASTSYSIIASSSLGCVSSNTAVSSVVVNAIPIIAAPSASICSGATTTLTASGANTYTWSNSSTSASIVVSPTINTTYTVSGTSAAGCNGNVVTTTVTVGAGPAITVNSSTICSGTSATLTATGVTTFTWSSGANSYSIVVSPSTNTVYTVSGHLSGCAVTASNTSTVSVNPTPTISANSGSICSGNTFTIVPSGANAYTISGGSAIVSPSTSTSYTINGTNLQSCSSGTIISVSVEANPTLSLGSPTAICAGQNATLTISGANSYVWSNSATTASIVVSPSVNTSYSVVGTNSSGCNSFTTQLINVNAIPILAVAGTSSICSGQTVNLTASGASTYSWSTGASTASISATPSANIVYTVTGTNTLNCSASAMASVSVIQNPTVSISGASTLCANQSLSLTATGANTYSWNTGATSSLLVTTPTANISYTVTGTNSQGCTNTDVKSATVNANPTVNISGSFTICNGQSTTLTANGADSYSWNTSAIANTVAVSPTSNTTYTVTGTNTLGCSASTTQVLTVNSVPSLSVTGTSSLCTGQTLSLTASGAATYSWNTGATAPGISATPSTNITYTVTGTNSLLCSSSMVSSVTVAPNPTLTFSGSTGICTGQSATLNVSGANTYSWNTSATSSSIVTTPLSNTTYTVTGTDLLGCSTTSTQLVTVSASLAVSIVGPSSICLGQSASLSGNGASSYTWNTSATSSSIAPNPTITTTYSLVGTSGTCSNTALFTVTVNPTPTVSISGNSVICSGQSTTLTANGASSYTWSSVSNATAVVLSPSVNSTYTLTGADAFGCSNASTFAVVSNSLPLVSITPSVVTACLNTITSFTASGASTYSWSNSSNTASTSVTATSNAVYTVSGTDGLGCTANATVAVSALSLPLIAITPTAATVCMQSAVSFTASGASTYTWNNGANTASNTLSPAGNTVYVVNGTDATNGCSSSASVAVITNSLPVITVVASHVSVCPGATASFTATGALNYTWSVNGANSSSISITPTVASVYTVTGSDANACVANVTVDIGLFALPTIVATPAQQTICLGEVASFAASGAANYTLSNGDNGTSAFTVSPATLTQYTLNGVDVNSCMNSTTLTVDVSECTGIGNHGSIHRGIHVFPNPSAGKIATTFEFEGKKVIQIFNEIGQCIETRSSEAYTENFDLSLFAKGMYYVRISSKQASANFKVIVH